MQLNGYLDELVDALFCEMVLGAVDRSKTVSFSSFLEERKEKCPSRANTEYSVTDTGIHPRSLKFRKNLSATSSKNKIARKNDLVFGISRKILNWGLFDAEIGEVSSAYRVYSINDVPPEYVARYIARYQYAFADIIKPSSREGQGIMPDALMAKKLPKLNYFVWEKYLDTVAPIKALASITRTETAALFELKDSILPKLMSGEIDVSEIDLAKLNSHLRQRRPYRFILYRNPTDRRNIEHHRSKRSRRRHVNVPKLHSAQNTQKRPAGKNETSALLHRTIQLKQRKT